MSISSKPENIQSRSLWLAILLVYIVLLLGIGNVAFRKQYFNDAESILGQFMDIKQEHQSENTHEGLDDLINSLVERTSDSANDLQELASQCFNIVLGALLAFLSSSTTSLLQNKREINESEQKDKLDK